MVPENQKRSRKKTLGLAIISLFAVVFVVGIQPANAQTAQEKFAEILANWKAAAKSAAIAGGKFSIASREEATSLRESWRESVANANRQKELLIPAAIDLFEQTKTPSDDLIQLLVRIAESEFDQGRYERAFELSGLLLEKGDPSDQRVLRVRMNSAAMSNNFEVAQTIRHEHTYLLNDNSDEREVKLLMASIDEMVEKFNREKEIREREERLDNNPRVKIKTTKGTIEVELFEDEAPETVGNFIYLVEKGIYNEVFFHRVINHFMAQTGGISARGQRIEIGYTIYDECGKLDARKHFRGSLSMAKAADPNTGNSQFFINFAATPFLDDQHTVFGRVISGWDAVDRINRTHEVTENGEEKPIETIVPDRIISATVIRKRDHEYEPVRVD